MRLIQTRSTARSLAIAALLVAPALVAASTPHPTPRATAHAVVPVTGSYRLTVASKHARKTADLVVEQTADGYVGYVLTNESETPLTNIAIQGDTLRAHVTTSAGDGELVLRITDAGITGTLKLPMKTLTVSGERAY